MRDERTDDDRGGGGRDFSRRSLYFEVKGNVITCAGYKVCGASKKDGGSMSRRTVYLDETTCEIYSTAIGAEACLFPYTSLPLPEGDMPRNTRMMR